MKELPQYLYRGDCDSKNVRKLHELNKCNVFLTNLSNGGDGRKIIKIPINDLIQTHISPGWLKTHFLSFSEDKDIALNYASNGDEYEEYFEENNDWNFKLIKISTDLLITSTIVQLDNGFYYAEYNSQSKEFMPNAKIFLINTIEYLSSLIKPNNISIANAKKDKEWLVLPLNRFEGEFSSKLDKGIVCKEQNFKYI